MDKIHLAESLTMTKFNHENLIKIFDIYNYQEDLNDEVKNLKGMVHSVEKRANTSISEIRGSIGSIDRKVQELSAGGIKTQIFGVLLMIHGSLSSYYA